MSIFKQATKEGLRFETSKGVLTTEQLWELPMTRLANAVRSLKQQLEKDNDNDLSFLDESASPVDKTLDLKFNVVKAVYVERKADRDAVKNKAAKEARNQEILALIAEKQGEAMKSKSVEELTALLEE